MATPANRRQTVAQGGMFSTPKANFSRETQELLKGKVCMVTGNHIKMFATIVMMQESKLTNFQQRQLNQTLKSKLYNYIAVVTCLDRPSLGFSIYLR